MILYEMVVGRCPFMADTPGDTQYKVRSGLTNGVAESTFFDMRLYRLFTGKTFSTFPGIVCRLTVKI